MNFCSYKIIWTRPSTVQFKVGPTRWYYVRVRCAAANSSRLGLFYTFIHQLCDWVVHNIFKFRSMRPEERNNWIYYVFFAPVNNMSTRNFDPFENMRHFKNKNFFVKFSIHSRCRVENIFSNFLSVFLINDKNWLCGLFQ